MCDGVIDTLLNIQGKTNDCLNTHQDLAEMGIRDQLHPSVEASFMMINQVVLMMPKSSKE